MSLRFPFRLAMAMVENRRIKTTTTTAMMMVNGIAGVSSPSEDRLEGGPCLPAGDFLILIENCHQQKQCVLNQQKSKPTPEDEGVLSYKPKMKSGYGRKRDQEGKPVAQAKRWWAEEEEEEIHAKMV
ncbi:hypothetical protein ZHAS_00017810 [Anopheles sinensis]|uniref:Uncharacterized protein n=1 Tax=Anopheles sinensis TaxID=74873 RepID=A0A084WHU9_ANOSI|nr:hypothetical protein ZHAS_00017810 [Anopheles sinensis]